jgi:hypothetical protein
VHALRLAAGSQPLDVSQLRERTMYCRTPGTFASTCRSISARVSAALSTAFGWAAALPSVGIPILAPAAALLSAVTSGGLR